MPVMRYFFFVGAALLALMFFSDAMLPKLPVADRTAAALDRPVIRIHTDRKWPAAVVFDTSIAASAPAIAPPQLAEIEAPAAVVPTEPRVRNALAQLEPAVTKKPEPKPHAKRRIAKSRVAPRTVVVALQPRSGFFGTW